MNILGRVATGADACAGAEWWRGAVIYQIYPRSFADSNGDGVGDLAGIIANLDHVASLGVDGIWLSPFFQSPMKDFGYDVSDYRAVDPIFGSLDDFDALVARAHALGLKVVIDQVYSHTSDEHAWFTDSRSARDAERSDWYIWADARPDGTPPNNWQSVFGGPAWTWDARRCQYYLHNFLPGQPQLNGHNPAVQAALLDVARFWLDRGVDGFRLDAINFAMHDPALTDNPVAPVTGQPHTRPFDFQQHIHNQSHPDILSFLGRLRALLDSYGMRFTVAEIGAGDAEREMKAFTAGDALLNSAYGFTFLNALALDPALLREALGVWQGGEGEGWPSWAFSNHDAPRHISRWHQGRERDAFARMTLLLLMCLRGNVFLYQGEELGLPQAHVPFDRLQDPDAIANWPQTLGRDGARTPMPWVRGAPNSGFSTVEPWLPVDPVHDALAVDTQHANRESTLAFARHAVALRAAYPALRSGGLNFVDAPDPLVAFQRVAGGERLLCVFNLGTDDMAWQPTEPHLRIVAMSDASTSPGSTPPAILPAMTGYVAVMPA
jgi:alpha-glucosidase